MRSRIHQSQANLIAAASEIRKLSCKNSLKCICRVYKKIARKMSHSHDSDTLLNFPKWLPNNVLPCGVVCSVVKSV